MQESYTSGDDPAIHILYDFTEGPYGGGNQFLKGLRQCYRRAGKYAEDPMDGDVILFNSHNFVHPSAERGMFEKLRSLRVESRAFVHRIDGPVSRARSTGRVLDRAIYTANRYLADATVFQSNWSRGKNLDSGLPTPAIERTIHNASNPEYFYPASERTFDPDDVSLIATSWSDNWRKGFDIYAYLDETLDFDRYSMTFVGNTPIEFNNINHVPPQDSARIGELLRSHDIFITGSVQDTCSNSLIEALHCGLPAVARDDGGHPELVDNGGRLFKGTRDVAEAIEIVVDNYQQHREQIEITPLEQVAEEYYELGRLTYKSIQNGSINPKSLRHVQKVVLTGKIHRRILQWRFNRKMRSLI